MLRKYENDLLQKEHSGCAALLRDDKVRVWCVCCVPCVWFGGGLRGAIGLLLSEAAVDATR